MISGNRNISLRGLRVFCLAAEKESFRLAAELAFLTASAVSHQIKQLETELGFRLFERTPRSLNLTPDGRALYDDVRPLLTEFDDVVSRYAKSRQQRTLRISVQPFFGSELFVPRLPEFTAQHPDLDISVNTSDESPEKHPEIADVSIRLFSKPPTTLQHDLLFPLHLTAAGSGSFYDSVKVRAGRIVSHFPLVIHERRPRAWHDWERSSRISIPDHQNSIRLDSMIAVARAAEQGIGAALVPKHLCEKWFESSSLVPLFDHELVTGDALYLVSRKRDRDNPDVAVFKEWVLQTFARNR